LKLLPAVPVPCSTCLNTSDIVFIFSDVADC
jgi:hypothetical protein